MSSPASVLNKRKKKKLKTDYMLCCMLIPGFIYLAIFEFLPLFGIVIGFQDFKLSKGVFGSKWIGLDNINEDCDGAQVSIETVIAENPEVIVLFDYEGGPDMDEMIQSLYDNAALQDISAIKNHKVIALDFSEIYGGGGDMYTAMSDLADQFYGE